MTGACGTCTQPQQWSLHHGNNEEDNIVRVKKGLHKSIEDGSAGNRREARDLASLKSMMIDARVVMTGDGLLNLSGFKAPLHNFLELSGIQCKKIIQILHHLPPYKRGWAVGIGDQPGRNKPRPVLNCLSPHSLLISSHLEAPFKGYHGTLIENHYSR